jgi:hypothetical protein
MYKFISKTFNGNFSIRSGGPQVLYMDTYKRMEPLNGERFLTALTAVPGIGVCNSIFAQYKCLPWKCWECNEAASYQINRIENSDKSLTLKNRTLIFLTGEKILHNPGQYILFLILEGSKMFFWESTTIGFVNYPGLVTNIFKWGLLKNSLRLIISFLTFFSLFYLIKLILRKRKTIFKVENPILFMYLTLLFIISFVAPYTIFCTITRYYLPIAPLYLIIIAYVFQNIREPRLN